MTALIKPSPRNQADAARTAALVDAIVSLLSIQPPDSPVHDVTQYLDGFYIPFNLIRRPPNPPEQLYVYILPWSRGWSIFTDDHPNEGCYNWRDVPQRLKGLQQPIYNPRDTLGPHQVSAERIVTAILDILDKLDRLNRARLNRYRKERWYWWRTIERRELNGQVHPAD
jgi:hypothetical protein